MRLDDLPSRCLPSNIGREHVYLVDTGDDEFPEPFYGQSLVRLRAHARLLQVRLPLGLLPALADAERLPAPRGLIFHTGRCGSTLLANMLGAHPSIRMIKEPEPVNQVLLAGAPASTVVAMLRAFARGLPEGGCLIVKCTSWNVLRIRPLLTAFPATAAVFLWRPAAEVVASCLDQRAAWQPAGTPATAEFYARSWRDAASAALDAIDACGDRVLALSYADIKGDPGRAAAVCARHFAVPITPRLTALMAAQSARYAKGTGPFDPAGTHSRPPLSPVQADAVERITGRLATVLAAAGSR